MEEESESGMRPPGSEEEEEEAMDPSLLPPS